MLAYMCKTDWNFELGKGYDGCELYSTIEDLKEYRPCVEECGIVEIEVTLKRVVQESNYEL